MRILVILAITIVSSCTGKYNIGELRVEGIIVHLSSVDQFEPYDPIHYKILTSTGEVLVRTCLLSSSEICEKNLNNFTAKANGEIIYITYQDKEMVFALYNVRTKQGYPAPTDGDWDYVAKVRDRLANNLTKLNPKLNFNWNSVR